MRLVATLALCSALGLAALAAPATAQRGAPARGAAPRPQVSAAFNTAYIAVLNLARANNLAGARDAYAKLVATSDGERYTKGVLGVTLGEANPRNDALVIEGADLVLGTAFAKPDERAEFSFAKGTSAADPQQGLQLMLQAIEAGYKGDGFETTVAGTYYKVGDLANGDIWVKRAVEKLVAGGKSPADYYLAAMGSHLRANSLTGAEGWAKLLAGVSLAPQYWNVAINLGRRTISAGGAQAELDMMRLLRRANGLSTAEDYLRYIEAAGPKRLPGEVNSVIAEGKQKGVLKGDEPFVVQSGSDATNRIASADEKASIATVAKDAAAAADGRVASGGGDAMLGYGDYAQAASLYQTALSKGVADADRVKARLGIAKASAGDAAGAEAAFKSVTAGPWKTVADYWLIFLQAKAKNAPTTVPSAAS